jgi:MFS family permease
VIAYFIAVYSMVSMATDGLGISQSRGAVLQSLLGAGQMIGRPLWGFALDRGGRINMTIVCFIICGLSCLVIWLLAKSFGVMVFFAIVQGFTGGTVWSAAGPITARVVGIKDLASAMSVFWLALVGPALVGQPMSIALRDYSINKLGRTGAEAYYISIGFCGGTGLASAILLYGAKWWLQGSPKVWQKS